MLRAIYSPDRRKDDHIDIATGYDDDLLINLDTASFIEWSIFFFGYYEPEVSQLVKRVVGKGQVAFDVGANIGCHTLLLGKAVGESGRVVAVEPCPPVYEKLRANICLNRMAHVQACQCALSDVPGKLALHIAAADVPNQGMSSLYPNQELSSEVLVDVQTLDDIMQRKECNRLDFIKIDTEGNDGKVIVGGERSIREHRPYVLFEFDEAMWGRGNMDFSSCEAFFRKQDYALYVLQPTGVLTKAAYGLGSAAIVFAVPPTK